MNEGEVAARSSSWRRAVQRLAALGPVSWLLARLLRPLDGITLRLTRGGCTATAFLTGLPVVFLTTTGARSGLPRTVPLVGMRAGETLIVIASNFGSSRHPAWYFNLRAQPQVLVAEGGVTRPYRAREAQGEEREAYWRRAVEIYPGYEAYRRRAGGRRIPVIVLEPLSSSS